MQIQDVLKVVGLSTLGSFPWGVRVINLVNSFLPEGTELTLDSTGEDLEKALASLTDNQRSTLLTATISFRRNDLPEESQEIIERGHSGRIRINGGVILVLLIGFIALCLAFSLSVNSIKTGTSQDTSGLVEILHILADLAKTFFAPSTPQ